MNAHSCPICEAKAKRIADLEERVEALEQALETDIVHPPYDWHLGRLEAVAARCLARGPVDVSALLEHFEAALPTREGRARNFASVIIARLRGKLSQFGWIVKYASNNFGAYQIIANQQADFTAAMRGDGSHIWTPTAKGKAA